ncbi:MAG: ATP-dependent helicase [Lachnospiraceae bacterium]|nr:ATP-dependent helicase [Lachnospiraceae bacterium]
MHVLKKESNCSPMHNKEQQHAIQFGTGPLLVLAGPGSGKTYVITHRIIHLISECQIPPNNILVITFTKAAALEMQNRATKAYKPCSYVQFGTFHSIFYHILKLSNPNRNYQLATDQERISIIKEIIQKEDFVEKNTDLMQETENCIKEISIYKNSCFTDLKNTDDDANNTYKINMKSNVDNLDSERMGILSEKYQNVYRLYEEWLADNQKLDFDDMIKLCYQQLKQDVRLREYWQNRFSHILIDEFQDINQMQYETIRLLSNNQNIFAVGDDDQAIYSFRGSNPEMMKKFVQDYQAKTICLSCNYRSHKDIVEASMHFISHNKNRFDKRIVAINREDNSIHLLQKPSKKEVLSAIRNEIQHYKKKYPQKTQAVLTRTNHLAYAYQNMASEECEDRILALDMLAYLQFINCGQKRSDFLKIMNKPVRYIPFGVVAEPVVSFPLLKRRLLDKPWIAQRLAELEMQVEYVRKLDLPGQARYIYKAMGYETYYKENLQRNENSASTGDAFAVFVNKLKSCTSLEELKREYETDVKSVQMTEKFFVMTYHASKGLEFDRVYLPDLEYGKVPHGRMLTEKDLEEERRMFYVACTRAKESLWLFRDTSQIGSPFLQELLD